MAPAARPPLSMHNDIDTMPATPPLAATHIAALAAEAPVAVMPPAMPELSPAACAARLAELFPALFGKTGPLKPLKLRIQADIQQRAPGVFSRRVLGLFFSRYTTGNAYLKALTLAPHRFDLDGQPAGEISDAHRQLAAEELARRREVHLARDAAQRDARHAQETVARQARAADEQARRDRAGLLRSFESSTLTKANFAALKGLTEPALDALLAQARQERAEQPSPPLPPPRREWQRRDDGSPPRKPRR
jgi:ProP effector